MSQLYPIFCLYIHIIYIPSVFQLYSPLNTIKFPVLKLALFFNVFSLVKSPNPEAERENRFGALQAQHRVSGPWKAGDGGGGYQDLANQNGNQNSKLTND